MSSRKQSNVDEAVAALRGEGLAAPGQVVGVACHVGDAAAIRALVRCALDSFGGRLDILVSNAAVNPASGPILSMEVCAGKGMMGGEGRGVRWFWWLTAFPPAPVQPADTPACTPRLLYSPLRSRRSSTSTSPPPCC